MKKQTHLPCCSVVAIALGLCFIGNSRAQLCFDVFAENKSPFLQCADADFFFDSIEPGFDPISFSGSDTGVLDAAFDGDDIFDPGARPDNVLEPFFSSVALTRTTGGLGGTTSFTTAHRGSVSMAKAESEFQSVAYGTRSRVTFMPVNLVDPDAPITITLKLIYTLSLTDPLANDGSGAALGGFGIKLLGGNNGEFDDPEFDVSALAELDLDIDAGDTEPEFFGFDDPELDDGIVEIDFAPSGPGIEDEFDIEIDIEIELDVDDFGLDAGEPIVLETDTFGSIFTDGFESGDTAAWTAASPDTFTFTVSSPDPNVHFNLVGAPFSGELVPDGGFQMYKPGTNYTVPANFAPGNAFARGLGDDIEVAGGSVVYSDGSPDGMFGDGIPDIDLPGWVTLQGTNDLVANGVDGSTGMNLFAAWGGDGRIQSAESLGTIEAGKVYTLSTMVGGPDTGPIQGPLAFYLAADGVRLTPSQIVDPTLPNGGAFQKISRTYDADSIAGHIGAEITIVLGVEDANDFANRVIFDDVSLVASPSQQTNEALAITSIDYVAVGQQLSLTWRSRVGEKYTVRYSRDLKNWESILEENIDAEAGATTTLEYPLGNVPELVGAEQVYFRVEKQ